MEKKRWRFFGVFVYGFFAFLEIGDLFALLSGGQVTPDLAETSAAQGSMRLVIIAILSVGIIIASLATAYALLTRAGWARYTAGITSALLFIYGAVQILGGLIFQGSNQTGLIFAGIMYILLGMVANWIGTAAQPLPRKTT